MENQMYSYYAFVSYNHKDSQYAKMIQNGLERYRIPATLRKDYPHLPKKVSPVFMDVTDLVAKDTLQNSLYEELSQCRYLIVICSPNSAASPWVNREVEFFLKNGRKKQIVPIIVSGTPHAKDSAQECLPPALRELRDEEEILGISLDAYGREGTILRLVATLLNVRLDRLQERDRAYRRKRRLIAGSGIAAVLAVLLSVTWFNLPHTKYYRDYTYVWEKPVGIGQLSRAERKSLPYSFRLTSLRGQIVDVAQVNSADVVVNSRIYFHLGDAVHQVFHYDTGSGLLGTDGDVSRVECYDIYGRKLYEKKYSSNLKAVDFAKEENSEMSFALSASFNAGMENNVSTTYTEKSDIVRYIQSYDANGYLVQRMYKRDNRGENGGTPVQDINGVWGVQYSHDEYGHITCKTNVDKTGAEMADKTGIVRTSYAYNSVGNLITMSSLRMDGTLGIDSDGYSEIALTYDEQNRLIRYETLDDQRNPTTAQTTYASFVREYDARGFVTQLRFYDMEGNPCTNENGVVVQRITNDANGRACEQAFFGFEGEPRPCKEGYEVCRTDYDDDGKPIRFAVFHSDGTAAFFRQKHYHAIESEYQNGNLISQTYLDTQNRPMNISRGFSRVERDYNEERMLTEERTFDAQGNLVVTDEGYAVQTRTYEDGLVVENAFFDHERKPIIIPDGYATARFTYERGLCTSRSYFGENGEPVENIYGIHRTEIEYDDDNYERVVTYYGADGQKTLSYQNFCVKMQEYNQNGQLVRSTFYDIEGQPAMAANAGYELRNEYDKNGRISVQRYYYSLPSDAENVNYTQLSREFDFAGRVVCEKYTRESGELIDYAGYALRENQWDGFGNLIEQKDYSTANLEKPIEHSCRRFDVYGNLIQEKRFDENDVLIETIDTTCNEHGELVKQIIRDGEGNLMIDTRDGFGYCTAEVAYDDYGHMTDAWFYGTDEKPMLDLNKGAHHRKTVYSIDNLLMSEEFYGLDDEPIIANVGCFHRDFTYDNQNLLIEEEWQDVSRSYMGRMEYIHNSSNYVAVYLCYDKDENVVGGSVRVIQFPEVFPGEAAELAGIKNGDLVLQFREWSIVSAMEDPYNAVMNCANIVGAARQTEKRVVVFRPGVGVLGFDFPEGGIGARVTDTMISLAAYNELVNQYTQWLTEQEAA